jgi:hypothetical protein
MTDGLSTLMGFPIGLEARPRPFYFSPEASRRPSSQRIQTALPFVPTCFAGTDLIHSTYTILLLLAFAGHLTAQDLSPINHLREPPRDELTRPEGNSLMPSRNTLFGQSQKIIFVPVMYPGAFENMVETVENQPRPLPRNQADSLAQGDLSAPVRRDKRVQPAAFKDANPVPATQEATAENPEPDPATKDVEPTLMELIVAKLESVKGDTQLDDATKSERLQLLSKAQEWVQKRQHFLGKVKDFKANIDGFEKAREQAATQLKSLEANAEVVIEDAGLGSEQLQGELQRVQSELDAKKSEIESLQNAARHFAKRVIEVPKQKSEAQDRLRKIQESIGSTDASIAEPSDEADLLKKAIGVGSEAEVEMLNLETHHLEVASQLNRLHADVASRQLKQLTAQFKTLEQLVQKARKREVDEQIRLARQAAMEALPSLADMAQRNQELAGLRKKVANSIESLSQETARVTKESERVVSDLADLRKQVDEGLSQGTNLLLAESRRQLISPLESQIRLSQIKAELDRKKSMKLRLEEEKEALDDPQSLLTQELGIASDNEQVKQMAFEFIEVKRSLIDNILSDYRSYGQLLVGLTVQHEKLVDGIWSTEELLRKHMVLVRSTEPMNLDTLKRCSAGSRRFFSSEQWSGVFEKWSNGAKKRPYSYLMFGVGFVALSVIVKRLKESR